MKPANVKVLVDNLQSNTKFLDKVKDLAQSEKFEPVPPRLQEYWVTIMWFKGVIGALHWAGYEIKKKDVGPT